VSGDCQAYAEQRVAEFPGKRPRKQLPTRSVIMPVLLNGRDEVLLERRPPSGIWGGLWSLPECEDEAAFMRWCEASRCDSHSAERLPPFKHTFSHYHLMIHPYTIRPIKRVTSVADAGEAEWQPLSVLSQLGLPAPVRKLLLQITAQG
jgi:A/G-specific adenine glycosylase